MMDYNYLPLGVEFALSADRIAQEDFSNLSDDEKREYIERRRGSLTDKEVSELEATLGEDAEENKGKDTKKQASDNPYGIFRGPGIG